MHAMGPNVAGVIGTAAVSYTHLVIVQFGGQTAINLAASLKAAGVKVFGTSVDDIDRAEDRERFDEVLEQTNIARPQGASVTNVEEDVYKRQIHYLHLKIWALMLSSCVIVPKVQLNMQLKL